ncbi:MAG TPA: pitrilysin family protein [Pyrinomonadaceae bacterium]|nr:pitrilysin family protein [Pyrinomonadaceae bacterium]
MNQFKNQGYLSRAKWARGMFTSLLIAIVLVAGSDSSRAQQTATPQTAAPLSAAQAQQQTVQGVVAKQAALVSEFDVNGLKVLLKRREGSLTVAAGLFIRGGSANINAQNAGIETLMLSTATEATTGFPRERMRSELSRMGSVIGSSSNNDYSVLSLATTRMHFDRSWEIFTDVVLRPSFTKEDVALVQERLVVSLSDDTDNPDVYLQKLQERVAYAGHPYLNSTSGTPETVAKLTPEDLRRYHADLMQTSRLLLVIVGDLNPGEVQKLVSASFGKLPRGTYKPGTVPQLTFDRSSVEVTPRELPTNYIQGLFAAPSLTSPDIYAMRVASSMLRDRVFEEVRVKRNLSYAPDAFLRTQAANVGGLYVTAVDANQSIRVMLNEIGRLQTEPVSSDDIHAVVAQYLTTYYLGQETNAAQAGELAQYELIGGGWRNSVNFLEKLTAVTPADIQRVAQKYMRNIRFVVLGNPKSVDTVVFTGQAG